MRNIGKKQDCKRNLEKNKGDVKMNKLKNEKGITLINLIIVFLLILILAAVLYLVYANLVSRGIIKSNNNLANDTNIPQTMNNSQGQQNNLNEENELNNNSYIDDSNNTEETDIIITGSKDDDETEEIDNNVDLDEPSNSNSGITSENTYKTGDTINIERNKMEITIDSIESYTNENGYEMKKAKVTFTNNNEQALENLSPLYYMIKPVSIMTEGDILEENEYFLKSGSESYEDNLLEKPIEAGETITGYIYWQSSKAEYIKISSITGIIDSENNEYSYGDSFYVDISEEN